jgi:phosphomevalonate kinase
LAGGYLVLDPAYFGVVVSTSSRFYTAIESQSDAPFEIDVLSPQFLEARWRYKVNAEDAGKIGVDPVFKYMRAKLVIG